MGVQFHQLTAALYLIAGLLETVALILPAPRLGKRAVGVLGLGWLVHSSAIFFTHHSEPTPALSSLSMVVSCSVWMAVLFYLLFLRRARIGGLIALMGPAAFLGVFFSALRLSIDAAATGHATGLIPHAHVLLAAAGLALLGVAGLAGMIYLIVHRALKTKQALAVQFPLPSLEALNQINVVALTLGFPLLTLGLATGMIWLAAESGRYWLGSPHEIWTSLAWGVYAVLTAVRFGWQQSSREAAISAIVGFGFLLFAVIGIGVLA